MTQTENQSRAARRWVWLEQFAWDFKHSVRSLRRAPGFSAAVIVTLALCIGANSTILTVLYGLVLKPLPFREPRQLVEIYNSFPKAGQPKRPMSVAQYIDYKQNADLFAGFALCKDWSITIGAETSPTRAIGARVTADFFTLLGVQPMLGRFFTIEESLPGKDHVIVLTQTTWETRYRADPAVVGTTIWLTGDLYTIVGVAPRTVEQIDANLILFKPYEWNSGQALPRSRLAFDATMYARVKSGVKPVTALAQLETLEQRYHDHEAAPALRDFLDRGGYRVALGQVRAEQTKAVKTGLLLLQGGALLVLLLGCVNVSNLMLARANVRKSELAIRQALGASRGTLARQLCTESLVLATLGAIAALALGWASLRLINSYTAGSILVRQAPPVRMDETVLGSTLLVALAVALFIGLLPMVRLWRINLLDSIQGGSRNASSGVGMRAISGALVTAQVALAVILLIGASLLIRSFARVMAIDPGFDASRIVHARVAFNAPYQDDDKARATGWLIAARMQEIPGVEAVGMSSHMPINGQFNLATLPIRGSTAGAQDTYPTAEVFGISPEFFTAMGIRVIEGRAFTAADNLPNARSVYIVDRDFAEKYFHGRSAVGQGFGASDPKQPPNSWPIIVGVVEPAKFNGPEDRSGVPFAFAPVMRYQFNGFSLELRTRRPLGDVTRLMQAKLSSVDPTLPLYNVNTLEMLLDNLLSNRRGMMLILTAFAAIAMILSTVGLYGMLAYDVTQRTREIGIRGAIGASRGQIVGLILRQGLWKAGLGLVAGLIGAFLLSGLMRGLLFDVQPTDPAAFVLVSLLLMGVALVASFLPARRAARIDPIVALRYE